MTFLEQNENHNHFDADDASGVSTIVADPKRTPETAGKCSVEGCGCAAYVRAYNGDCDACGHSANSHY